MFGSIYSASVTVTEFLIMAVASLLSGAVFAWIMSFKVRSTKRFFIVNAILPFTIATVITFVSGNIGAGVAFGGAFALIRFRSSYPEIPAYRNFSNSFFRVTVGDFRTKSEALRLLSKIKYEFPAAFLVHESIHYPAVNPVQ